ncbi:MAG: UDP-N-acetylmuramate--L-alanine ligase [Anaerolineae bacterium]
MAAFALDRVRHIHFVGIGGAGLSAIARVVLERGHVVSGSDLNPGPVTEALARDGATIYRGHKAVYARGADAVVRSSAVRDDNPEVAEARSRGVPVFRRADFLPLLLADRVNVAVAGTHGKTTTTGMIAHILEAAGLAPGFIVGGEVHNLGTNARAGQGAMFVIEADEYDNMFLGTRPQVAVITNIEHDHPDMFADRGAVVAAFAGFVLRLPENGLLVACGDDLGARALGNVWRAAGRRTLFYGLEHHNLDWRATGLGPNNAGGTDFVVERWGRALGSVRLTAPGRHNVLNALAALAAADYFGVLFEEAEAALHAFVGVGRRFEVRGQRAGVTVIDDYAHHPTAIRATLAAARARYPDRTLWAVWQPHTYTRTRTLLDDFAQAFGDADRVLVTDIYAAREQDTLGLTGADVAGRVAAHHPWVRHVAALSAVVDKLAADTTAGDVVVVMSAGDAVQVGGVLLERLAARAEAEVATEANPFLDTSGYEDFDDPFAAGFDEEEALIEEFGDIPKDMVKEIRRQARARKVPITRELVERVRRSLEAGADVDAALDGLDAVGDDG